MQEDFAQHMVIQLCQLGYVKHAHSNQAYMSTLHQSVLKIITPYWITHKLG